MRLLAGSLLALMIAVFAVTSALEARWPWLAYVRAFSEAAMVGACADWFAVVALFRHPFGIPIPHTAIVPHHKQRIAENFGRFISTNFLAPAQVIARLENLDAAGWLAHWLKQPENARLVAQRSQGLVPPLLELLGAEQLRAFSRSVIRNGIDSVAAAPLAARVLSVLVARGHHDAAFDLVLGAARTFLDQHRDNIRSRIAKGSLRWLPNWVDARLADAFVSELQDSLAGAHADDHPWRTEFRAAVNQLAKRLANDAGMLEEGERLKSDVLDNGVVDGYLEWLGQEVETKVKGDLASPDSVLAGGLEHALFGLATWLDREEPLRALINQWVQQLILNTVVPNRAEIGDFVTEVMARWETRTLIDKLELQVGKDLQYIRINGTVVGGLVGLVIFTVARALS